MCSILYISSFVSFCKLYSTHEWLLFLLFSHQVVPYSLWLHELQHIRISCPSLSPWGCSNSCPVSQWYHPTISSCHPLLLLSSTFPSIKIFSKKSVLLIRWPKYWSFSITPYNKYSELIPLGMTGLISLLSRGLSGVFSSTIDKQHQFSITQHSLWSNSHIHTWLF